MGVVIVVPCGPLHVLLGNATPPSFLAIPEGGARLGGKWANDGVFQEKAEISLCRAMLVTEGVHRAPSLQRFSRESPFRGQRPCVAYGRLNDMLVVV